MRIIPCPTDKKRFHIRFVSANPLPLPRSLHVPARRPRLTVPTTPQAPRQAAIVVAQGTTRATMVQHAPQYDRTPTVYV